MPVTLCKMKRISLQHYHLFLPRLYELLLHTVIHNCYLKFINSLDISKPNYYNSLQNIDIHFPETLGILVLNWPYEELILRNQIPSLDPPVDIFPSDYGQLASQTHSICQVEDMLKIFNAFCKRLIQFIIRSVFNCTPATNIHLISCNLRRLDVSGLVSGEVYTSDLPFGDIIEGISNSELKLRN